MFKNIFFLLCSFCVLLWLIYLSLWLTYLVNFTCSIAYFGNVELWFNADFCFVRGAYFFDECIDSFVFYQRNSATTKTTTCHA